MIAYTDPLYGAILPDSILSELAQPSESTGISTLDCALDFMRANAVESVRGHLEGKNREVARLTLLNLSLELENIARN